VRAHSAADSQAQTEMEPGRWTAEASTGLVCRRGRGRILPGPASSWASHGHPPPNSTTGQEGGAGDISAAAPPRRSGQGQARVLGGIPSWGSMEAGLRSLAVSFRVSRLWHTWLWRGSRGTERFSVLQATGHVWRTRDAEAPCGTDPRSGARLRKGGEGVGECAGERERGAGQEAGGAGKATQASLLMQYFSQPEALHNVTLSYAQVREHHLNAEKKKIL